MLYRPHFCCHCGEKIVRAHWTPLSSRRFCEFCEIEQKQHDLLPRAVMVLAVLFGSAGLVSYFGGRDHVPAGRGSTPTQTTSARELKSGPAAKIDPAQPQSTNTADLPRNSAVANKVQLQPSQNSSIEAVYFCGAITKKGTPCTRRVKTKGRCWQHAGQ
jgi:hypothetical protein